MECSFSSQNLEHDATLLNLYHFSRGVTSITPSPNWHTYFQTTGGRGGDNLLPQTFQPIFS